MVKQRIGGVLKILRSAAPVDPDAEALWRLIQTDFHDNQRVIVESLQARRALRPGLEVTRATDILWTLNHPDVWLLLVGERGWTPEQWEQWFADTTCAQLLRHSPTDAPRPGPRTATEGRPARDDGAAASYPAPAAQRMPPRMCARNRCSDQLASVWPSAVYQARPRPCSWDQMTGWSVPMPPPW